MERGQTSARLRVAIITQMFTPEMGAASARLHSLATSLADSGHEVLVATGMPNYPAGRVQEGYRGRLAMRESIDGFEVVRTAYFTTPRNRSRARQLLSYLSFVPASFVSALRAGPLDAVVVSSPPLFPVVAGWAVGRLRRAPLVLDLRDLWPDEFVACGAASEGSVAVRALRRLEAWAYSRAKLVVCTTESFASTVVERRAPRDAVRIVSNGAELDDFRPLPADNPVARGLGLDDRFVVAYVGALGIKHDLDVLLDAARLLQDEPEIVIALVGAGAREAHLRRRAGELGLANVAFVGARPIRDVPGVIAGADVCFTSLLPDPYLESIQPVKLFEYMACGKPVVAAVRGEGARLVEAAGAGLVVPPGAAREVADAILRLRSDAELREDLGRRGRRFVEQHYSRAAAARRFAEALSEACAR